MSQTCLRVWFYDPRDDDKSLLNTLVAAFDPPYCHCEIQLPNNWACSIYMNQDIHFKKRAFSNKAYTCFFVPINIEQLKCAENFIFSLLEKKLKFSTSAMLGSHYGLDICPEGFTFCSKIVTDVLLACNALKNTIQSSQTSPSTLAKLISCQYDQSVWSEMQKHRQLFSDRGNSYTVCQRAVSAPVFHPPIDWNSSSNCENISFHLRHLDKK